MQCEATFLSREVVPDHVGGLCRLGPAFSYCSDSLWHRGMKKVSLVKLRGSGGKILGFQYVYSENEVRSILRELR